MPIAACGPLCLQDVPCAEARSGIAINAATTAMPTIDPVPNSFIGQSKQQRKEQESASGNRVWRDVG